MYARCGKILDAKQVFKSMEEHDIISWNSMLSGVLIMVLVWEIIELFEHVRRNGIRPNYATFLIVLTAFSHVGLVDKGLEYFN